jgi:hypothetical protein
MLLFKFFPINQLPKENKMKRILILVILVLMLTIGQGVCAEDENYFPLKVGNTWNYTVTVREQKLQAEYKVAQKTSIEGQEAWAVEASINGMAQEKTYYFQNAVGVFSIFRSLLAYNFRFEPAQQILKYPVAIGDFWEQIGEFSDVVQNISFNYQLNYKYSAMVELKVPAGTFTALKVTGTFIASDGSKLDLQRYFVNGVGLIKEVVTTETKNQKYTVTSELSSYQII